MISIKLLASIFVVTTVLLHQVNCAESIFESKVLNGLLKMLAKTTPDSSSRSRFAMIGEINDECKDRGSWCITYKTYCYADKMKEYCKKTCNQCPTPKPTSKPAAECKDSHSQCDIAFGRGYCKSQIRFMEKYCPKTCNFCSDETDGETECNAVDKNQDCYKLKKHCTSSQYKEYMKTNCAKTCSICQVNCGVAKQRSGKIQKPIVGGASATKGFYPWQVAIYYEDDFLCGGSLISEKHVLTAAHCFRYLSKDFQRYKVVLGDHDRTVDEGTEKTVQVKRITQHDEYNDESDTHDIALIKLKEEVTFTDHINRICLASSSDQLKIGTKCYLSGWGKTRFDGTVVNQLMHAAMPIADLSHCRERNSFNHHVVNNRMICAGFDDGKKITSGCHGDSGGPLACEQPDKSWLLHGVVSWGSPQCSGLERYTVFSKVSKYSDWIEKQQKK